MNRYTIPKSPDRAKWLAARWATPTGEKRVTASAAAVVHGQHKFISVADYAIELSAPTAPTGDEANDAMMRGTNMQPVLAKWGGEIKGVTITEPDVLYCYDEPGVRLLATIDGVDESGVVYEIKTFRGYFDGTLPAHWLWQGIQQAICADVPSIEWIIFDSSLEIQFHTQHVSSDERQEHISACRKFLGYIDAYPDMQILPPDAILSYENVTTLNPRGVDKTVELPETAMATLERLALAKAQIKEGEAAENLCKAELGQLLGDAEYGEIGGHPVISWKTSSRTSFDQKAFGAAHPALLEKFKKTAPVRTMRILLKGE